MARSLAIALFGLLALAASAQAKTGWGTAYSGPGDKDATGFNACQFGSIGQPWETMYAAIPTDSFDMSMCGRCIKAKGLDAGASGKWVKAMVVDACATCSGGDVDFSTTALEAVTGFSWDRKQITWEWTDCGADVEAASADEGDSEESNNKDSEDSNKDENKDEESDSNDDSEESSNDSEELEGDLNGDGKLSKKEKKKLKKKKEQESRRLLRA